MLGLVEAPVVPRGPCARCGHRELIRALAREITIQPSSESNEPMVCPLAISYAPRLNKAVFGNKVKGVYGPDPFQPVGMLDMFVCLRCGFTEWYAREPSSIPLGPGYGTEKVTATE